MLDHRWLFA